MNPKEPTQLNLADLLPPRCNGCASFGKKLWIATDIRRALSNRNAVALASYG
jgi:hypothetical protein